MIGNVVTVRACGDWQRLLNLCKNKGIELWDVERAGDGCTFCMRAAHFPMLVELCRKCSAKVAIIRRRGLGFWLVRHGINYSFLLGFVIAMTIVETLSLYVWDVSVEGNSLYTQDMMRDYLAGMGVGAGTRMSGVDCDSLEKQIRNDFPEITWVSVEKSGTCIVVHVKENDGDEQGTVSDVPVDIVAASDGVVEWIVTRQGQPMVGQGSVVKAGDVLVSGELELCDDYGNVTGYAYVAADADVRLKTVTWYEDSINAGYTCKVYTDKQTRINEIHFFGKKIRLGGGEHDNADVVTEHVQVSFMGGIRLPVSIDRIVICGYELQEQSYSAEELECMLKDNHEKYIKKMQEKGIQIVSDSVTMDISDARGVMSGELQVLTPEVLHRETSVRSAGEAADGD
jgi:similar to stage IV sporulation protein